MKIPYPLYIRKTNNSGTMSAVIDTNEQFGVVCAAGLPLRVYGSPKELPENDWHDADGKEVFIPDAGLPVQAYDMEVTFYCKGTYAGTTHGGTAANVKAFLDYLLGRDGNGADLTIYDTYTGLGRQNVTVSSISDDVYFRDIVTIPTEEDDGTVVSTDRADEFAVFKVTFTVHDPVTQVTLSLK